MIQGLALAFAIVVTLGGCASSSESPPHMRGVEAAERSTGPRAANRPEQPKRPAALLNGIGIPWTDLHPALAEIAGAVALEELILGRLIEEEVARRGLTITTDLINAEREHFAQMVVRAAGAQPDEAARLVSEVRRARRLGDWRYDALLRRNAGLRLCVKDAVDITPTMIQQRFDIKYGPRIIARVITVTTEIEATRIVSELRAAPEPQREILFIDLAMRHSTDESRPRGGLLEPISPADPTYENAVRSTLARLSPGQISGVVALDQGYAVFFVRESLPAENVLLVDVQAEIESELRRRQERILMDELARQLLAGARVSPLDRAIQWSWRLPGEGGG